MDANKNIFANTYQSSIYDVAEVAVKKENSISIPIDIKTKSGSDQPKTLKTHSYHVQQGNKGLNEPNFISLSNLSQEDKIKIVKTSFQFQVESKIFLKKYYENTDPNSLFQLKGYSIKYESIRRTSIYKSLKE